MMRLVFGLAVGVALVASCDKAPTSPTVTSPGTTSLSARPSVTRVDVSVPESVPPGQSVQFTAMASFADGSTRNITDEAVWVSGDPSVLSISKTGLAAGHRTGDVFVSAAVGSIKSGQKEVLVLPPGTYKVGGYVEDGEVPVPEARVDVVAGSAAGLFAVTRPFPSGGSYTLLGVGGDTQFRVTKDGYHPLVRTVPVTSHQQINFDLTPLVPRTNLSATYTLTISAAAHCRSALPEETRTQKYTAVLTQDLARLTATLTGANSVGDESRMYNSFDGAVEPTRAWFQLRGADFYVEDPLGDSFPGTTFSDVFVQLTASTFVIVGGLATTVISPAGLSGTLDGVIETVQWVGAGQPRSGTPQLPKNWQRLASCRAVNHEFVISR
jgi:Bacterial Ig-like domain (group 2)